MVIKVKFLASLAECYNDKEVLFRKNKEDSALDIWIRSTGEQRPPEGTLCAVNFEKVEFDNVVRDEDEVAFFPPVTGG